MIHLEGFCLEMSIIHAYLKVTMFNLPKLDIKTAPLPQPSAITTTVFIPTKLIKA